MSSMDQFTVSYYTTLETTIRICIYTSLFVFVSPQPVFACLLVDSALSLIHIWCFIYTSQCKLFSPTSYQVESRAWNLEKVPFNFRLSSVTQCVRHTELAISPPNLLCCTENRARCCPKLPALHSLRVIQFRPFDFYYNFNWYSRNIGSVYCSIINTAD